MEINACGGALCGRVVSLRSPLDEGGCDLRDKNNPDPTLRNRPLIGLEILRGLFPSNQTPLVLDGRHDLRPCEWQHPSMSVGTRRK